MPTQNFRKKDPFYERELKNYAEPIASREYIIAYLKEIGQSLTRHQLIEAFALENENQQEALRRRLIAMRRDGQIIVNRRGQYALVDQLELVRGRVIGHKDGFGFLVPDDGSNDIFLSPREMRSVFPDDIVLIRVITSRQRPKRREGIIVEKLAQHTHRLVGRYIEERNGVGFVQPDNKNISQDILIPPTENKGTKQGQFVVAEITMQPTQRRQATGRITEILGDELTPGLEIELAIRSHDIPYEWPEDVLSEIKSFQEKVDESDKLNRKDLRELPLVTIDGIDAKDFDDAVYCEPRSQGGWRLYVAIADVSHYVNSQTALDEEAILRGNSVYLPGRVVPMLPPILSNELCSLKPHQDRLCMVCEMLIDKEGSLIRYKFYEAVMHSKARLTYDEVAKILTDKQPKKNALLPHLKNLKALYEKLIIQRKKRGALEFETTETRIIFGEKQKIKTIIPIIRNIAHKIIEECMLLANVAAARFLSKHKIPILYRVHEPPDKTKLEKLQEFLSGFGLQLKGRGRPTSKNFADLIDSIKGRPDIHLIQTVLLRSLMQAVYMPTNSGHFGLGYNVYTHFTSPIRRYPDLLVHRAIRHLLQQRAVKDFDYNFETMLEYGRHCSSTERRADTASYDCINWLKCHYMQNKVGKEYDGIITSVTGFGVFVELQNIYVEGLLHITSLKNDYYHYDDVRHLLSGKRTGAKYRLGDPIKVQVARVDLANREIDFELVV